MKITLSIITFFVSTVCFAGGVDGTRPSPGPDKKFQVFTVDRMAERMQDRVQNLNQGSAPQIVFSTDILTGQRFQYGTFNGHTWDIQQYNLNDVQNVDPAAQEILIEALKESRRTNNWVPVPTVPSNN